MFGIVIVNAIRSRGVDSPQLITRYAIIAGLIAGVGLALVYISLFRLGAGSHEIAAGASNGAAVLHAYVQHTFGSLGSGFLAVLIALACLVTAVGLTCACAEYFSQVLPLSYRMLVGAAGWLLAGGVEPGPDQADRVLDPGADGNLPALHRAGGAEFLRQPVELPRLASWPRSWRCRCCSA